MKRKNKIKIIASALSLCMAMNLATFSVPAVAAENVHAEYEYDGFQKITENFIYIQLNIDNDTGKSYCLPQEYYGNNESVILYTPAEGSAPALLEVHNLSADGYTIDYEADSLLNLKVTGSNNFDVTSTKAITLTGDGDFNGKIEAPDFSLSDDFTGKSNWIMVTPDGEDPAKQNVTIYGEVHSKKMTVGIDNDNKTIKFAIPEKSKYVIADNFIINNVGDNYGQYFDIKGKFVNDIRINVYPAFPTDPAEFIRSLKLTGTGLVYLLYGDGHTSIYNNSGDHYVSTDLNFTDPTTPEGDLDKDGYHWNKDSYTLELKDVKIDATITLPNDKPVTIDSTGNCFVGDLVIEEQSGSTNGITFTGNGELTIDKIFNLDETHVITVAEGAKVTTNNGLTAKGSEIIVNGYYNAICGNGENDAAVLASRIKIGPNGIMNVKGKRGVCLHRETNANYLSFEIEEGGQFIADCDEYGLVICNTADVADLSNIVGIPEGYIPHGYEFVKAGDVSGAYDMILALKDSIITFDGTNRGITSGNGAEGYIVVHKHSENYDKYTPDPDNSGQHIKSCTANPDYTHFDSAAPHNFAKWTYNGNGSHAKTCSDCDYCNTNDTEACTWGEWIQTIAPTETTDGLEIRTCSVCGGEESKVIPMTKPADADGRPKPTPNPGVLDDTEPVNSNDTEPADSDRFRTLIDTETGISVSGVIPEGVELLVKIDTERSTASRLYLDISLVMDGREYQPEGVVTVKIPVPKTMNGIAEKLKVYRFIDENYTNMNAKLDDGYLVFTTDHFSIYVVTDSNIPENEDDNTDDNTNNNAADQEPDSVTEPDTVTRPDTVSKPDTGVSTLPDTSNTAESAENSVALNDGNTEGNPHTGSNLALTSVFMAAALVSLIVSKKKK